jgi:hypothetical protein
MMPSGQFFIPTVIKKKIIWLHFLNLLLPITKKNFLLGILDFKKIAHITIFLWLKHYIYTTRCAEKALNITVAIFHLKKSYEILKYIPYKNGKNNKT